MTRLTKLDIAKACAANDDRADAGEEFTAIIDAAGVEVDGALHVAEQRALRLFAASTDQLESWKLGRRLRLFPGDQGDIVRLQTAWLDGFLAGRQAGHERIG